MILIVLFTFYLIIPQQLFLVNKVQEKFETIKTLEADFVQSANSVDALEGRFYFKKLNNYRIELLKNVIISDGTTIWNKDLKKNKVVISNIEDDPLAFSLSDYIYNYPPKCDISEEPHEDGFLLILNAKNSDVNFKTAKLWVSVDYVINKIMILDFTGNSFVFQFNNIQLNKSYNDNYFTYQNNSTDKIIDLR